jgi:hypothetical protein
MEYIAVLLPSLVVGLLFWFAMRAIFNADKSERRAEAQAQAEADAKAARAAEQARYSAPPAEKPQPGKPADSGQEGPEAFPPAGTSGSPNESDK